MHRNGRANRLEVRVTARAGENRIVSSLHRQRAVVGPRHRRSDGRTQQDVFAQIEF